MMQSSSRTSPCRRAGAARSRSRCRHPRTRPSRTAWSPATRAGPSRRRCHASQSGRSTRGRPPRSPRSAPGCPPSGRRSPTAAPGSGCGRARSSAWPSTRSGSCTARCTSSARSSGSTGGCGSRCRRAAGSGTYRCRSGCRSRWPRISRSTRRSGVTLPWNEPGNPKRHGKPVTARLLFTKGGGAAGPLDVQHGGMAARPATPRASPGRAAPAASLLRLGAPRRRGGRQGAVGVSRPPRPGDDAPDLRAPDAVGGGPGAAGDRGRFRGGRRPRDGPGGRLAVMTCACVN